MVRFDIFNIHFLGFMQLSRKASVIKIDFLVGYLVKPFCKILQSGFTIYKNSSHRYIPKLSAEVKA